MSSLTKNTMRISCSISTILLLGDNVLGLTAERDFLLDNSTYHQRSTDSSRLPGALVEDFQFTL
jgi:hypothetical protein